MAGKKRSNLDNILYCYVADDVNDWITRAAYYHRISKSYLVDGLLRRAMEKDGTKYPKIEKLENEGIRSAGITEQS